MQKRRIKCEYDGCGRTYCSYFNLKRHIESSHMGLRKFKCPICGRFLSSKQNYVDHQNIHTGAKPYLCEFQGCNMRFRQLSQYYIHSQLHNEESEHPYNLDSSIKSTLCLLSEKLSLEAQNLYTIPLLPYSIESIQLPKIVNSDNQQLSLELPSVLIE